MLIADLIINLNSLFCHIFEQFICFLHKHHLNSLAGCYSAAACTFCCKVIFRLLNTYHSSQMNPENSKYTKISNTSEMVKLLHNALKQLLLEQKVLTHWCLLQCAVDWEGKRRWLSGVKMLAVMCLSAATKAWLCRVHTDGVSSFVCSVSHVAALELPGLALWAWLQA